MRLFESICPDGRVIRRRSVDAPALKSTLLSGYDIVAEVIEALPTDRGGFLVPIAEAGDGTLFGWFLAKYGDRLREWFEAGGRV